MSIPGPVSHCVVIGQAQPVAIEAWEPQPLFTTPRSPQAATSPRQPDVVCGHHHPDVEGPVHSESYEIESRGDVDALYLGASLGIPELSLYYRSPRAAGSGIAEWTARNIRLGLLTTNRVVKQADRQPAQVRHGRYRAALGFLTKACCRHGRAPPHHQRPLVLAPARHGTTIRAVVQPCICVNMQLARWAGAHLRNATMSESTSDTPHCQLSHRARPPGPQEPRPPAPSCWCAHRQPST